MDPVANAPFVYPPTFLFIVRPLGLMPYEIAYVVWMMVTLALLVWAIIACCTRLPLCVMIAIIAPASTATLDAGQNGFLFGALIIAGIRLSPSRPILAGVLFGILAAKPQLAVFVPVALAAGGLWRTFSVAAVTAVTMAVLATLVFGWACWPEWLTRLPGFDSVVNQYSGLWRLEPTVHANLRVAGVDELTANVAQGLAFVAVAIIIALCFRRSAGGLSAAALLTGTILGTPYAFIYDLPMVSAAVVLFIQERAKDDFTFDVLEVLAVVLVLLFPVLMMLNGPPLPVSTLSLTLFFGVIVRRQFFAAARRPPLAVTVG
jgi:hypothetical protein